MSFTLNIKKEILEKKISLDQANSFLCGLIASSSVKKNNKIIIKLNISQISLQIRDMLSQMAIKYEYFSKNKNWIIINNFQYLQKIKMPSYFIAGIFVGGGSISSPFSTSYHLEIQIYSYFESKKIQMFLNKYGFIFNLIKRKKIWVLYLKKAEQISDFLKVIQAFNFLLKFEEERIKRDFQIQLNRYSNLDTYNQQKLAKASEEFKENYNYVVKNNLLSKFNKNELLFFQIKKNNPYYSLSKLAILYQKKVSIFKTKSGLNHWLIKLRQVIVDN